MSLGTKTKAFIPGGVPTFQTSWILKKIFQRQRSSSLSKITGPPKILWKPPATLSKIIPNGKIKFYGQITTPAPPLWSKKSWRSKTKPETLFAKFKLWPATNNYPLTSSLSFTAPTLSRGSLKISSAVTRFLTKSSEAWSSTTALRSKTFWPTLKFWPTPKTTWTFCASSMFQLAALAKPPLIS